MFSSVAEQQNSGTMSHSINKIRSISDIRLEADANILWFFRPALISAISFELR